MKLYMVFSIMLMSNLNVVCAADSELGSNSGQTKTTVTQIPAKKADSRNTFSIKCDVTQVPKGLDVIDQLIECEKKIVGKQFNSEQLYLSSNKKINFKCEIQSIKCELTKEDREQLIPLPRPRGAFPINCAVVSSNCTKPQFVYIPGNQLSNKLPSYTCESDDHELVFVQSVNIVKWIRQFRGTWNPNLSPIYCVDKKFLDPK